MMKMTSNTFWTMAGLEAGDDEALETYYQLGANSLFNGR